MTNTKKFLLNNVNLFLSMTVEQNSIIKTNDLVTMFAKIFNNDTSYMKLCPDGLEYELQELVKYINKYDTESFRSALKILLICFNDEIRYDMIRYSKTSKELSHKEKDIIWFKALLAKQVSFNMLAEYGADAAKLNNFKIEHSQLGVLLNNFYSEKDSIKINVIKNIINSKVNELYKRYNISFTFPLCAAT